MPLISADLRPFFALAFVAMLGFDVFTHAKDGYLSVFPPFASWWATQMFTDLSVALALACGWIASDLRQRGKSLWWALPWVVGAIATGTLSPLAYMATRPPGPRA
ncbi:MAG: hypothetical protein JWM80_3838 [Cyanobacteria bacterium RYN_339]|nr:hypothetical protein [Cyanobacteria bacterium RYN_339]